MEKQPELYSIEQTGKGHMERKLRSVSIEVRDKNEELKEAQEILLKNDELYRRFFKAIIDRENMNSSGFTYLENLFIIHCQNLPDSEIESIVKQFNKGVSKFAEQHKGTLSKNQQSPENILQRKMTSEGIISVVDLIRYRKELHNADPKVSYGLYVEDILDSKYKIDLIECIFEEQDGKLNISTMELFQVKSSMPTEDKVKEIIDSHKAWIDSCVMDFDSFRQEYEEGIPDEIEIKEMAENYDKVSTILMNLYTDPNGFNPDHFIDELHLEDLNNKQKAWLLYKHADLIKKSVIEGIEDGVIPSEEARSIIRVIDETESRLMAKAKLPRNIAHVHNVRSVISVGRVDVKVEVLKSQEVNDPSKEKILKYN